MTRTSSARKRGAASRSRRGLKVLLALALGFAALLALNAFVLDRETDSAAVNITNGQLVDTTSGQIQVVDTAPTAPLPGTGTTDGPSAAAEAAPLAPPLVLIHGSGGAIDWWDELTPLLAAQGRRVIAIDMLGYGGSDKPASGYSIESQAGLLAQVLSGLGVESAAIVGHSLGGKVATALAEGSPDLVAGITIIDTAPDSSYGDLGATATAARLPVLGPALWRISPDFTVRRNLEQAFAPGFEVPEKFVDDIRAMTYPAFRDTAEESDKYSDSEPVNSRLERLELPLLVIFGGQDQIYPAREALSAYAAVPGVQTLLIPEAGHSPQVESPAKTAVAIGRFVNSLAPEPRSAPRPGGGNGGGAANRNESGGNSNSDGSNRGQGGNRQGNAGNGRQGGNGGNNGGNRDQGDSQPGA